MLDFLKSTVGRKYIMGLTGLVWMGFVFTHMAGNMLLLFSADSYNAYGHAIVSNKLILYSAEVVLLLALIVHVVTAISLTIDNRAAKKTRYAVQPSGGKSTSIASRTMGVQGSLILFFIINHLITFKYGVVYETTVNGVQMRDLSRMLFEVFAQPGYVAWYAICLIILMFHLSHGVHSIFQSFGFLERKMQAGLKTFAWIYALVVAGGFLSQPLYVFFFHS